MLELFESVIKFDTRLLILDIILIVLFFYSWYISYKKTGYNIDYWYSMLFLQYLVPVLFMYPFGRAELNIITMGPVYYYRMETFYDKAFIITLVGFFSVFAGKYYFDKFNRSEVLEVILYPFTKLIGKPFYKVSTNALVSRGFCIFYVFILLIFIIFTWTKGLLGHPREFFQAEPLFRPIYHLINFSYILVFYILAARTLQFSKLNDKILFFLLMIFGFFLGVRAPLILQLINYAVLYTLFIKRGAISFSKIFAFITVVLIMVLGLGAFRNTSTVQNDFSGSPLSFLVEIFYGNTFSDTRDFGWVLSYWDENLYFGKSYVAALMSFVPSALSSFRDTWSIGKLTVRMVGFNPEQHPGLRPGMFGENYLNFGIIGVVLYGFAWGYIQRRIDYLMKYYAKNGDIIKAISVYMYSSFIFYLSITAAFPSLYTHIFLLLILFFITKIKISLQN